MRDLEDIYTDIAQTIVETIDQEWKNASIYIEFYGDSAHLEGVFDTHNLAQETYFVHHSVLDLLVELNSIINPDDTKPWNRAKFYLEPDGEFNMEFAWDQKLADEIDRLSKED